MGALNIWDHHTGFQISWPLFKKTSEVTAADTLLVLELACGSWADLPEMITTDQGTEFKREFAAVIKSHGLRLQTSGVESHWQAGEVEARGKAWKANRRWRSCHFI